MNIPSTLEARQRLAQQQRDLLRKLTGWTANDTGIDAKRVEAARVSLANKRLRTVQRAWPALSESLGDEFAILFAQYAESHLSPEEGGPLADGREFVHWLSCRRPLADAIQLETLWIDLNHRPCNHGLIPRRGITLKSCLLLESRRLMIGCRIPFLGAFVF